MADFFPTPSIHSQPFKWRLIEDNTTAMKAVDRAILAVELAAPQAQDFPQRHDDLRAARRAHEERVAALKAISASLAALIAAIEAGGHMGLKNFGYIGPDDPGD